MSWSRLILINKQHGEQEAEQAATWVSDGRPPNRYADEYPRGWGSGPCNRRDHVAGGLWCYPIGCDSFRSDPFRYVWNDVLGGLFQINCCPRKRKGPPRVMFILHKCCPKYRSCKHITNRTPQLDGSRIPKSRSDPNPSHRDYAASGWASSICICPKSFGCVNICLKFRTPTTPKECI